MNTKLFLSKWRPQVVLFLFLVLGYGVTLLPAEILHHLTDEDQLLENLTALFFFLTSFAFLLLFISKSYFRSADLQMVYSTRPRRYVFLLLTLVFFFGFAEEISWGQRIFGFATPESMVSVNAQGEFNIHNLEFFDGKDVEGNRRSVLERFFAMKQLFLYFFFTYLFLLPLLHKNDSMIRGLLQRFLIPVPSLWLGILFIGNFAVYGILRLLGEAKGDKAWSHGLNEVQEFNFSLILLLTPFVWLGWPKKNADK